MESTCQAKLQGLSNTPGTCLVGEAWGYRGGWGGEEKGGEGVAMVDPDTL